MTKQRFLYAIVIIIGSAVPATLARIILSLSQLESVLISMLISMVLAILFFGKLEGK